MRKPQNKSSNLQTERLVERPTKPFVPTDEIPDFVARCTPYFDEMYKLYFSGEFKVLNDKIYSFMVDDAFLTVPGLYTLYKIGLEHETHFFDERLCKAIASVRTIVEKIKERGKEFEDKFPPSPDQGTSALIARDDGEPILWTDFGRDVQAVLMHITWTIEWLSGTKFGLDLCASFERMFGYMLYVGSFFDTLLLDWNKNNKLH